MGLARQHPFISPIGCGAGLLLILGVAGVLLFTGGEQFSPGDLSAQTGAATLGSVTGQFASHAEFETDCGACHAPFMGISATRCEQCHPQTAAERANGTGVHGNPNVGDVTRCQTCHTEHQGRQTDLLADARRKFNHQTLAFSLARHRRDYAQRPLATDCAACHTGPTYTLAPSVCIACHAQKDPGYMQDHTVAFGEACLTCHDGVDKMTAFDHGQTPFPLKDRHAAAACAQCHQAAVAVKDAPTTCAACHPEPAAHAGMFGTDCATCHTAAGWSPANLNQAAFDHVRVGFALTSHTKDYSGAAFTCRQCHPRPLEFSSAVPAFDVQVCVTCHTTQDTAFMADHTGKFGPKCLSCHDGSGNMANFDHQAVFALDGKHAAPPLACDKCHVNRTFKGTPRECAGCHAEPKVHAGLFGADCAACHTPAAWTPARLTQHTFPLNHGEKGESPCLTCHTVNYSTYTCYGCHEHTQAEITRRHAEENISGLKLNDCMACHAKGQKEDH